VFVEAQGEVPLAFHDADAALAVALSDGGLTEESRRALDAGGPFVMHVGPQGSGRFAKQVLVDVLPEQRGAHKVTVPLRWEPTGVSARWFPTLEANLTLAATPDGTTAITLVATYTPPLDALGANIDRLVLRRAATATMSALVREIAAKLVAIAGHDTVAPPVSAS
jgi:hypothetical protein